jgi:hypothetical protein
LNLARADDVYADLGAGLAGRRIGAQFGRWEPRDFDVQIDAFEQWPEILPRYRWIASGWQRPEGSPAQPHGHRGVAFLPFVRVQLK